MQEPEVVRMEGWTDEELKASPLIRHVVALIGDADLLASRKRYGTAFALALIAFEEVGKAAMETWKARKPLTPSAKRKTLHLAKQGSASCLLLARVSLEEYYKRKEQGLETGSEAFNHDMLAALAASAELHFASGIPAKAAEIRKHAAFYFDGNPLDAEHATAFEASDFESMKERCFVAIGMMRDALGMTLARALYEGTGDVSLGGDGKR